MAVLQVAVRSVGQGCRLWLQDQGCRWVGTSGKGLGGGKAPVFWPLPP